MLFSFSSQAGQTPLEVARQHNNPEVALLLTKASQVHYTSLPNTHIHMELRSLNLGNLHPLLLVFCCERFLCFYWHCGLASGLLTQSLSVPRVSKVCRLSLSMKCCQRSLCPDWQRVEQSEALVPCSGPGVRKLPCTQKLLSCVTLRLPQAYPIPKMVVSTGGCFAMGAKCLCPAYTLQLCVKCCNALRPEGRWEGMRPGTILALILLVTSAFQTGKEKVCSITCLLW